VEFRVSFAGPPLSEEAKVAIANAGARWEGSDCDAGGACRHSALVEAETEQDAVTGLRRVLAKEGAFGEYDASPITDARGRLRRAPSYRSWQEIDWQSVPERAMLGAAHRAILGTLLDAAEPTWIIAADPYVSADRATVEAALNELRDQGLVHSVTEEGGEPGNESALDRWWAITDGGWDVLGLIKSPGYR
jgi:hypothetical protein